MCFPTAKYPQTYNSCNTFAGDNTAEEGGIFSFAQTDNGDFLFWETAGAPNKWRIIVNEGRGPEWEIFDLSMTEFIAGILTGQLKCTIFPEDFPPRSPKFEPID